MNIYHCMIELKDGARALAFAAAVEAWMNYLKAQGLILDWRLLRRKFRLASGAHTDFLLEIDVGGLADLFAEPAGPTHMPANAHVAVLMPGCPEHRRRSLPPPWRRARGRS